MICALRARAIDPPPSLSRQKRVASPVGPLIVFVPQCREASASSGFHILGTVQVDVLTRARELVAAAKLKRSRRLTAPNLMNFKDAKDRAPAAIHLPGSNGLWRSTNHLKQQGSLSRRFVT